MNKKCFEFEIIYKIKEKKDGKTGTCETEEIKGDYK